MLNKDYWNNPEPLDIYLARPDNSIRYNIRDYVNEETSSLTIGINQQYELDLEVVLKRGDDFIDDYLQEGMQLFVDKVGFFKMDQPTAQYDGAKETKTIKAYSCDSELEDKNCTLSVNMGLETSMEYLVTYDDGETELLVNPYTNIPYDWIVLYNTFPEQLTWLLSLYNAGHFGEPDSSGEVTITSQALIDEINGYITTIPRLKSRLVPSVDLSGLTTYTSEEYVIVSTDNSGDIESITLTDDFASRVSSLITFYTKYRNQLSLLSLVLENTGGAWSVGNIYGVSNRNFSIANTRYQFEIDSTIYAFLTQDLAQTINCVVNFDILRRKVNVTPVENIGDDSGIVVSYSTLVNTLNIETEDDRMSTRLYVTGGEDLGIEQVNFGLPWVDDITYKLNARDSKGNRIYVSDELAEKYLDFIEDREVLRDEYIQLSKDYRSYTEQISEIQYRVPNDGLMTDWGTFSLEELQEELNSYNNLLVSLIALYKEDYTPAGLNQDGTVNEDYIKTTMYWYDYDAYQNIIEEIECAIDVFPYYSDQSKWSDEDIEEYKDRISAWETDWTLYGTIELNAKVNTYKTSMDILVENGSVYVDEYGDAIPFDELTPEQQAEFGDLPTAYRYDEYNDYKDLYTSSSEYLATLEGQIADLQSDLADSEEQRQQVASDAMIESNFTADECKVIYRLFKDADYENENILSTDVNTSSEELDIALELLRDGQNQAYIMGRPQLVFSIDAENLFGLSEFEAYWRSFVPGNYMLVQYKDDVFLKLRMVSYEFNPLLPSRQNMTINFSNYLRSRAGISDIESILGASSKKADKGIEGVGISSITEYYALSNSTTAPSDSMFSPGVKTPTALNRYLWNYELITYTDGTTKKLEKHIAAAFGDDGNGISSITEYYALSQSTTAPADSAFNTQVLTPTSVMKYLWNYELITYTNGSVKRSDKRIIGTYGETGEAATLLYIDSSNGVLFKNNSVSTVLTVTIYKGSETVTNQTNLVRVFGNSAYLQWYVKNLNSANFVAISRSDSRLSNSGFTFTISPLDVDVKSTFKCELVAE